MKPYEVYIRSQLEHGQVARILACLLGQADSKAADAYKRESSNLGGTYYRFEVIEVEFLLLRNAGDVEIPERGDFQFYLVIRSGSERLDHALAVHVARILERDGLVAEVDSLSA
ncbi:hypothetical protein F9L07_20730 [Pimelobacter simplex]|uniref:Uncharacterized protein n=1 Tax=Nocardioides simplex TaxID=2045 RepID=A0A7J5DVX1_NOCSI|nr:hypothetical protein [Pimelobacter simplex]KAB2809453.1 hypothetical protein F9L07_20730 [Pimelobacter simplex]